VKKALGLVLCVVLAGALVTPTLLAKQRSDSQRYLVLAKRNASGKQVRTALRSLGARVVKRNTAIGLSTVVAGSNFASRARKTGVFTGVARDRVIGWAPRQLQKPSLETLYRRPAASRPSLKPRHHRGEDPLFRYQWNLRQVGAGPSSYEIEVGDPGVLVGVMDTGISEAHADIGKNFNEALSRNFTTDIPLVDGKCKNDPDKSCSDPANVDEGGHGTWVATTIAGARNHWGISGVAPGVTLVNLRAGQDSGFFFLQPTVDAMTYAGDNGIDIVNMSFFTDPWLYNCTDNPADSPQAQEEQRTIIEATQRAVTYARDREVTLITAAGNGFTDLGKPEKDTISPDFPPGQEYKRDIDNSCLTMPSEAEGVVVVSGTGPSGRKAFYSDYGTERVDVAAPGGDTFDTALPFPYNGALAAWTKISLREFGLLGKNGKPNAPDVIRRCRGKKPRRCSYWVFFQGTSIASPTAAGVAALIVSRFGQSDGAGGMTMAPAQVESILMNSASPHPCPEGGVQEYPRAAKMTRIPAKDLRAVCEGSDDLNGFYGHGIVNALEALEP
jgi:lantibiotic leader peptide-processing serine protease